MAVKKNGKAKQPLKIEDIVWQHATNPKVYIKVDHKSTGSPGKAGSPYHFSSNNNVLTLYSDLLNRQYPELLSRILNHLHDQNELIVRSNAAKTLHAYNRYHNNAEAIAHTNEILTFFGNTIDADDKAALRAALYLKHHAENGGGQIDLYREDIKDRFGSRGINIANLCSAGYFDTEFKEKFKQMKREEFREFYEIAVGKRGRALFVHANMDLNEIEDQFIKMIGKAVQYHLTEFRIHAKGKVNVGAVQKFIKSVEDDPESWQALTLKRIYYKKSIPIIVYEVTVELE